MAGIGTFWIDHPVDDSPEAEAIRVQQVATMFGQTPMVAAGNMVNSLITVLLLRDVAPPALLIGWVGILWLLSAYRLQRWWRSRDRPRPNRVRREVARRAVFFAGMAGVLWGGGVALMFPGAPFSHQVFLAFATGGMAGGAAMALSAVPLAAVAFVLAAMLPVVLSFPLHGAGEMPAAMGLMLALFTGVALLVGRTSYQRFIANVRISLANSDLLNELAATRGELLELIANMPVAFALFDGRDRLLLCSDNLEHFLSGAAAFERPPETARGYEQRPDAAREARVKAALADYRGREGTFERELADGRWLQATTRRTRRGGSVTVLVEVSELKAVETAQREAKETAENANEAKSRFLASASHDLRQPLQALDLLAASVEEAPDEASRKGIVRDMAQAIRIMSDLLNSLLDISRLDVGAIEPDVAVVPVDGVLRRMENVFSLRARAKGLDLRIVPCGLNVETDAVLLERIVENLLANAIRYTERGKILLGCRRRGDKLDFEVWDTGIGIPEEHQKAIFEEYYQLGNPGRDRGRGLGLGLAIVDRLSRLLDHPVHVRSAAGKGSRFAVTVPISRAEAVPVRADVVGGFQGGLDGRTVVVIEDDEMILAATKDLLMRWGAGVVAAADSADALAQLADEDLRPDLVIADFRLRNGESGFEAARRVEVLAGRPVPAVIVTGDTADADLKLAINAGWNVLYKPVDPAKLRALTHHLAGADAAEAAE